VNRKKKDGRIGGGRKGRNEAERIMTLICPYSKFKRNRRIDVSSTSVTSFMDGLRWFGKSTITNNNILYTEVYFIKKFNHIN
jgi:hypothetical protein